MTNNNLDEFDQEPLEAAASSDKAGMGKNIAEAWRSRPLFKLTVIMFAVAAAIAGALGAFSGPGTPDPSRMPHAPQVNAPPGVGQTSPYFAAQNDKANEHRVNDAIEQGTSALPTPVGSTTDINEIPEGKNTDPLKEYRAELERIKQDVKDERQRNAQQQQQQQVQRPVAVQQPPEDETLAKAMQNQMQQLLSSWVPKKIEVVTGTGMPKKLASEAASGAAAGTSTTATNLPSANPGAAFMPTQPPFDEGKTMVPGGTVNYAQLLTEANSDLQAPILAQVLSGPLAGGRAIGRFQVQDDYLVLQFSLVTLKGKDYTVNALALDPDTTLSGLATEVDHRYFSRVILPAAGAFVSAFGSALGQGNSSTTVNNNGIIVDQAKRGINDALYAGLGNAGQTAGQFFSQAASQIKPLVRVAVGTPLGLFFLTSVKENQPPANAYYNNPAMMAGGAIPGYAGGAMPASTGTATQMANPYAGYSPYGNSTGYNPYGTTAPNGYGAPAGGYSPNPYGQNPYSPVTIITPGQSTLGPNAYGRY